MIVVGCGGVGSHAAAALARSGCGRLRLIDFDQVTLSSLNRHAVATLADVGTPKVDCLRRRLEQVVPWVQFHCVNQLFEKKTAEKQLRPWQDGQRVDFVIDAIDNIESKVDLLHYCHINNIKVVSSMGAGCKSDPTRVFVNDISASTDDPLSKSTRRRLRLLGVKDGIPAIYSSEKPGPGKAQLLPLADDEYQKGEVNELGVLPDFRVRILPVLGTMPAVFGLCAANHIILEISDYPHEYIVAKSRDKMYDGILAQLQGSEEKLAKAQGHNPVGLRVPVTIDDVGYIVEEVFHGRSVVSGLATRLGLVRWKRPQGSWISTSVPGQKSSNLDHGQVVCMTKDEAQKHERLILLGGQAPEEVYDQSVLDLVAQRFREDAAYRQWS